MGQRAGTKRTGRGYAVIIIAACAVILWLRPGCHHAAPDLTDCTRIEVRYANGALNYFFPDTAMQGRILNEAERAHLRSYDTWTVTDQEQIKVFARRIGHGSYKGWVSAR